MDLCQAFGWTWRYVDEEVDLPMVRDIYDGFRAVPPTHWLMAGWVGYKAPAKVIKNGEAANDGPSPKDMFSSMGQQFLDG